MNPVVANSAISQIGQLPSAAPTGTGKTSGQEGFAELIETFVKETNEAQVSSDQSVNDLILGKTDNVQQVVMAVANAEMSFQLFMEIRNKLIDSYNELMRMQF